MYVGSTAKLIVVATVAATVARQCVRHRLRTGYRLASTGYRLQATVQRRYYYSTTATVVVGAHDKKGS
jgi:hypothetical protein